MPELTLEGLAARLEVVEKTLAAMLQAQQAPVLAGVASILGVNPVDVWEAFAQANVGLLTPHDTVFTRLRNQSRATANV
jgi:hypothetical protein